MNHIEFDWDFSGFTEAVRARRLAKKIGMLDSYDGSISPVAAKDGQFFRSVDGGYPTIFFDRDGETYCAECASDPQVANLGDDRFRITDVQVFWEGPPERCNFCNKEIESAYGDPDKEDN